MYELMQAGLCSYYMDCPSKVGFIVRGDKVCLVDTGGDKDAGKKALRLAQGRGWRVKLVLNTHSHADHIGGNRLVQQRTGAPVYAPGIEADFVRWPVLSPPRPGAAARPGPCAANSGWRSRATPCPLRARLYPRALSCCGWTATPPPIWQ